MARPGRRESPTHYHNHRARLRQRFMRDQGASMEDYELLELVLTQLIPRRDVKPLAKALVDRFGESFAAVIAAPPEALQAVPALGAATVVGLKVVQAAALRLTRQEVLNSHVIRSWDKLIGYCNAVLARETVEQVRLLLLDRKNKLIADGAAAPGHGRPDPALSARGGQARARPGRLGDHPGPQPPLRRPNAVPAGHRQHARTEGGDHAPGHRAARPRHHRPQRLFQLRDATGVVHVAERPGHHTRPEWPPQLRHRDFLPGNMAGMLGNQA